MKKLFLLLSLCGVLGCGEGWAAIACQPNCSSNFTKAVGASTTSASIDTTGATILIVYQVTFNLSISAFLGSDSKSNTWTACGAEAVINNSHGRIFYAKNPTVGTGHTITTGGSGFPTSFMAAYSGADTANPCDQNNTATGTGVSTLTLPNTTPSTDGQLVITGVSDNIGFTPTISAGFTVIDTQPSSSNEGQGWAYQIQTTATTVNPQWNAQSGGDLAGSIATFKASGGSPPTGSVRSGAGMLSVQSVLK